MARLRILFNVVQQELRRHEDTLALFQFEPNTFWRFRQPCSSQEFQRQVVFGGTKVTSRYKTRAVTIAASKKLARVGKLAMITGKVARVIMQLTDKDLLVTTVEG